MNPPRNRKGENGNPSPSYPRARFLSQQVQRADFPTAVGNPAENEGNPHRTLMPYLYGRKFSALYDAHGKLVLSDVERTEHKWEGKTIPSGFFKQPNAEHISAVISNPLGTISKFNRMGIGAGFGIDGIHMILTGTMHDHDPNAAVPKQFALRVRPNEWNQPWCGGLNVFHNPRALYPLNKDIFSEHAQHFEENGNIRSFLPDFHPYGAQCISVVPDRLKG